MKKIIAPLLLGIGMAVCMTSCLKNDYEPDPVANGILIHNLAYRQHAIALDPIDMAIRLNVLLTEAGESTDYAGIKFDGESALRVLFGSSNTEVKDEGAGIFTIKFAGGPEHYGGAHDGIVRINTSGKLLPELGGSEGWSVSVEKNNYDTFRIFFSDGYYNYNYYAVKTVSGLIAKGANDGEFNLVVSEYYAKINNSTTESDWSGSYTMVRDPEADWTYKSISSKDIEFFGRGSGETFYGDDMSYTIDWKDPLVYGLSCEKPKILGGTVVARLNDASIGDNPNSVKYEYFGNAEKCTGSYKVTYNEITKEYTQG